MRVETYEIVKLPNLLTILGMYSNTQENQVMEVAVIRRDQKVLSIKMNVGNVLLDGKPIPTSRQKPGEDKRTAEVLLTGKTFDERLRGRNRQASIEIRFDLKAEHGTMKVRTRT